MVLTWTWESVTPNHWVLRLPGYVTLEVKRNRSWKAQRDLQPFRTVVFGNQWAHPNGFAYLVDAQAAAEEEGKRLVRVLSRWAKTKTKRNKR